MLHSFIFQVEDGIDRVAAAENESGAGGFDIGDLLGMLATVSIQAWPIILMVALTKLESLDG